MKKACIFDLDGTLLDTIHTIAMYGNQALASQGLPAIDVEIYKIMVGNGAKNLVHRMLGQVGADDNLFDTVYKIYDAAYSAAPLEITRPYDGILEMLEKLKEKNIKTAVLSNKQHHVTREIVPKFFGDAFSLCYGQREGLAIKPDPAGVFEIIGQWGITAEECLYIGDTGTDMQTAKNAGAFAVGVAWGFRKTEELLESGADAIVYHPRDILKLL